MKGVRDKFLDKGIKGPQSIAIKSPGDKQNETDRRFQPLVSDASKPLFFCSLSRFGANSGTSSALTHLAVLRGPPKVLRPPIHRTCCKKEQRGQGDGGKAGYKDRSSVSSSSFPPTTTSLFNPLSTPPSLPNPLTSQPWTPSPLSLPPSSPPLLSRPTVPSRRPRLPLGRTPSSAPSPKSSLCECFLLRLPLHIHLPLPPPAIKADLCRSGLFPPRLT